MENMMLELQAKDSIRMFNSLVERCFHSCVNDFSSVSLSNKEKKCMYSCVDKFIQYSTKAGKIFAGFFNIIFFMFFF